MIGCGEEEFNNNFKEALYWYKLASEQGFAKAYLSIGDLYYYGDGFNFDYNEAIRWYELARQDNPTEAILGISNVKVEMGKYSEVILELEELLKSGILLEDYLGRIETLFTLADTYTELSKPLKSIKIYRSILEVLKINNEELKKIGFYTHYDPRKVNLGIQLVVVNNFKEWKKIFIR